MKLLVGFAVVLFSSWAWAADPLPSWTEGELKKSIMTFVADVTKEGGSNFVPVEDRIATFDNDGTLWSEVPTVEAEFTKVRLEQLMAKNPAMKNKEPYKTLLKEGKAALPHLTQKQILDIMSVTHSGMSEDDFNKEVTEFFKTALHPKWNVPYSKTAYQPMLELLAYLRDNNFKIFICSGGDIAFMRVVATEMYGVPSQNIIGSFFMDKTTEENGKLVVMRTSKLGMINDKDGKPVGIVRHIGKRPIMAVGNERSGGDIAHLRYSKESTRPTLQIMINHDDAKREAEYAEKDGASLAAARKFGFKILSMKNDWKQVFPVQNPIAQNDSQQEGN
ncbi:HAD family hydrolase [Bdellovibrio sp. HCB209]|uniref:HAD family hydrolase n=1 Tax=Bdellovibrio sp. HCB209 TaxID=3394354 RepID=UPI0039B43482